MTYFGAGIVPRPFAEVGFMLLGWFAALSLSAGFVLPQSSPLDMGRPDDFSRIFDPLSEGRIWDIQSGKQGSSPKLLSFHLCNSRNVLFVTIKGLAGKEIENVSFFKHLFLILTSWPVRFSGSGSRGWESKEIILFSLWGEPYYFLGAMWVSYVCRSPNSKLC